LVTSRGDDGAVDLADWGRRGMENLTPLWLLKYLPNMLACHVTIVHDCEGPSNTITCCEASGGLSLSESLRVIQRGAADACLTGGAESRINPLGLLRNHFAGRVTPTPDDVDPATVVRPFDPSSQGTVLGEGGGILVVEALETALARDARPYAEVVGTGATQSIVSSSPELRPDPDGPEIADAIELALGDAGIGPADVDAIAPFGSAVPVFDAAEASAIRRVFGDRAAAIPLITTVPYTGNCCAGNGAVALGVAAKCLRGQRLPARLNAGSAAGLQADAAPSSEAALDHVLVVSPSQGGQNTAVVLKRFESS
ncbi:MAG: beta-ketoacyl-[acyl-carrier-protein] synthase family protein, partial [Planctomycetota bacterium]